MREDVDVLEPGKVEAGAGRDEGKATFGRGQSALAAQHGVGIKNANVKISKLHPKMGPVIAAVAEAARELGLPTPVITSGNDSSHKQGSLHFENRALDFRGNNITLAQGRTFREKVLKRLGEDYDVLFETFANKSNNHLHVEFDPG